MRMASLGALYSIAMAAAGQWASNVVHLAIPLSSILFAGHVVESVYWTTIHGETLVLDKNTELRLSSILLPYEVYGYMFFASRSTVVQCQDGMLRIAFLHG
jgi:hypothetical protein